MHHLRIRECLELYDVNKTLKESVLKYWMKLFKNNLEFSIKSIAQEEILNCREESKGVQVVHATP